MNRTTQPHHTHQSLDRHNNMQTYTCTLIQISLLPQEIVGLLPSCLPLNSLDSNSAPIVKAKPLLDKEGYLLGKEREVGNIRNTIELQINKIKRTFKINSSSWTDVPRALHGAEQHKKYQN